MVPLVPRVFSISAMLSEGIHSAVDTSTAVKPLERELRSGFDKITRIYIEARTPDAR
jgi:hypothetical protein